jgi:hypothetical protein
MKTKLQAYVYLFSCLTLVCGLVMHIIARSTVARYESQQAHSLEQAIQQSGKYVEQNEVQKQEQLASYRVEFFCGHVFIGLGIMLALLWFWFGGRTGIWVLLLLLLVDVPFWMF